MVPEPLAAMIIGHLIGDYLLQPDWMAKGKKTSTLICGAHAALWTLMVVSAARAYSPWCILWLFVTHFALDRWMFVRWYMGRLGMSGFRDNLGPWSAIVVDNVIHLLTILLACRWFLWP